MLARVGSVLPRRTGGSPSSSLGLAAFLVTAMLASVATAALPYIPTTVVGGFDNAYYIFSPNGRSVDLLEVNFSSTLSASSFKPKTLATDLPFLGSSDRVAFAPTVLDNGILAVFAGDCAIATDAALWTYKPGNSGSAAWTKHTTAPSKTWDYGQGGPYFLGGSLSFAAQLAPVVSDPVLYVYGGMCPFSNGTGGTQSSATYSNRMLKLSPPITGDDVTAYSVSYAPTAGPPIAEAGFTFTELAPSISNRSGIVTQQTSHVLLGGHTQQAFINMSTAAIWNLPEETWNFVSISIPPTVGAGKNDLLAKDASDSVLAAATASSIDSRSGHTAVLSEDGTSLIVLGGWVGDTKQAAEPQLAVINIGASFSDWQWMVPAAQPPGLGFYGHGAALLPGNVMMVHGGYEITGSSSLRRRASTQMFFNISSLTWADSYTNPGTSQGGTTPRPGMPGYPGSPSTPRPSGGQSEAEESSSSNNKLPLGLGLGLGIPLLLIALGLAFCLYRRRARCRAERDETLRGLSQGMNGGALPFHHRTDSGEMLERDDNIFPWNAAAARDWYTGGHDPYVQGRRSLGYESLRGGNGSKGPGGFVPLPPPMARPRGAARGLYQPSTGFGGGGSGDYGALRQPMKNEIHPIYEDDEEEEQDAGDAPLSPTRDECDDDDDPFATPTNRSTPTTALFPPPSTSSGSNRGDSPERQGGAGGQSQDAEVKGWVSDVDAADAVLTAKISRHGSTTTTPPRLLTAQNHSSQLHPQSASAGRGVPKRRNSNRSNEPDERTNSNLSDRSTFSFVAGSERNVSVLRPPKHRHTNSQENRLGTAGSSTSGGSYSTAKSTFAALQAEGPSLLAGEDMEDEDYIHVPGSPSKNKPRRSWLGSLKRVFSGGTPSDGGSREDSPTRESLLNESGSSDYEPRLVGMGPNGTMLTRRKQGREAWDDVFRDGEGSGAARGRAPGEEEDEWDIERAVEQRLVQVMFTVPKERLRVVNAEIEKEEEVVVVTPGEEGDTSSLEGPSEKRGMGMRSSERLRQVASGESLRGSGSRDVEKTIGEDWLGGDERLSRELEGLLGIGEEKFAEGLRLGGDLREQRPLGDEKWSEKSRHDDTDDESLRRDGRAAQEKAEEAAASLLHLRPEAAERERAAQPGLSPSASLRTSSMTTTTLHTAEAVRLERPRTRVLEMVESIESKSSRESTPNGSPTRGK